MNELRRPIFSIGVAASLVGVPAATIRSWERAGLLTPVRGPNGWRMYSWRDIELLRQARDLRRRGMEPREIRRALRRRPRVVGSAGQMLREVSALPLLRSLSRGLERGRPAVLVLPVAVRPV